MNESEVKQVCFGKIIRRLTTCLGEIVSFLCFSLILNVEVSKMSKKGVAEASVHVQKTMKTN